MVLVYALVEWREDDQTGERVSFRVEDFDGTVKIDRLTDRLLTKLLRILDDAKSDNPDGFYLPIAQKILKHPSGSPLGSGAEIRVLRDGFFKLRPIFRVLVQELLDEYLERRAKYVF